jgi:hypothetical protein
LLDFSFCSFVIYFLLLPIGIRLFVPLDVKEQQDLVPFVRRTDFEAGLIAEWTERCAVLKGDDRRHHKLVFGFVLGGVSRDGKVCPSCCCLLFLAVAFLVKLLTPCL